MSFITQKAILVDVPWDLSLQVSCSHSSHIDLSHSAPGRMEVLLELKYAFYCTSSLPKESPGGGKG